MKPVPRKSISRSDTSGLRRSGRLGMKIWPSPCVSYAIFRRWSNTPHSAARPRAFTCRSRRCRSRYANSTSLGGRLVERESRGFLLTRLGREAHEQTLRILDETLLLETMGKRFEEGPLRVAVGVLSTVAPYLLPGMLERLQVASPRVELEIEEAPGQDLVSGLVAGRLDAAIVSLPLGILELPERELFEDCFCWLAGPSDLLRSAAPWATTCGRRIWRGPTSGRY